MTNGEPLQTSQFYLGKTFFTKNIFTIEVAFITLLTEINNPCMHIAKPGNTLFF